MSRADEPAFRPIPDWPQYEVSADGIIRSWFMGGKRQQRLRFPRYKKTTIGKDGYERVTLYEKKADRTQKVETFSVHRLVAICWLNTSDTTLDVAHLNGIKTDNRLENLKWCTRKENESHKVLHGTKAVGERNGQSKLCSRAVNAIKKLSEEKSWNQQRIADLFQISQSNVSAIILGKSWSHN